MQSVGIVRKVDRKGRLVLPKDICDRFDLQRGDSVEIFVDDHLIVLKKYEDASGEE